MYVKKKGPQKYCDEIIANFCPAHNLSLGCYRVIYHVQTALRSKNFGDSQKTLYFFVLLLAAVVLLRGVPSIIRVRSSNKTKWSSGEQRIEQRTGPSTLLLTI